jgi:hypothetical protein
VIDLRNAIRRAREANKRGCEATVRRLCSALALAGYQLEMVAEERQGVLWRHKMSLRVGDRVIVCWVKVGHGAVRFRYCAGGAYDQIPVRKWRRDSAAIAAVVVVAAQRAESMYLDEATHLAAQEAFRKQASAVRPVRKNDYVHVLSAGEDGAASIVLNLRLDAEQLKSIIDAGVACGALARIEGTGT